MLRLYGLMLRLYGLMLRHYGLMLRLYGLLDYFLKTLWCNWIIFSRLYGIIGLFSYYFYGLMAYGLIGGDGYSLPIRATNYAYRN